MTKGVIFFSSHDRHHVTNLDLKNVNGGGPYNCYHFKVLELFRFRCEIPTFVPESSLSPREINLDCLIQKSSFKATKKLIFQLNELKMFLKEGHMSLTI